MTVKEVENLSEKEKNEYQWTLSKTIEIEGKDIIKPDKNTQSILKQILDRLIILEDGQKQLVEDVRDLKQGLKDTNTKVDNLAVGQANMQDQINELRSDYQNLVKLNNFKTK